MDPISVFEGEHHFLSNFHPATFVWDNILWPTSEHAYQAAKVISHKHRIELASIRGPAAVKQAGKKLPLRQNWDDLKVDVMYEIVLCKFTQNPDLKAKLTATKDAHLEEGNHWKDTFWGICPPNSGIGLNHLGEVLMDIRQLFVEQNVK